jgi:phospholipid/cholesterol/gamma-HCH transport system substrate-binding protein
LIPKITNEIKVGLLVLGSFIVLVLGYNFLKGSDLFSNLNHIYAQYNNVDGLTDSKPVLVNGFQVGKVAEMSLQPNGTIMARLDISKTYPIPKNTVARLESTDLLGSKAIVLMVGTSKELAKNGDTLEGQNTRSLGESLAPLQNQTQQLIVRLDTFISALNSVINPRFQKNVDKSMTSISGILKNLELASTEVNKSIPVLNNTLKNVEDISRNFKDNDKNISSTFSNVKQFSDKLAQSNLDQTVTQLNSNLKNLQIILSKVNNGEGSMGALINDKQLYDNLTASTANLNRLMIDLKANPKRYVSFSIFGGKDKKKENP